MYAAEDIGHPRDNKARFIGAGSKERPGSKAKSKERPHQHHGVEPKPRMSGGSPRSDRSPSPSRDPLLDDLIDRYHEERPMRRPRDRERDRDHKKPSADRDRTKQQVRPPAHAIVAANRILAGCGSPTGGKAGTPRARARPSRSPSNARRT